MESQKRVGATGDFPSATILSESPRVSSFCVFAVLASLRETLIEILLRPPYRFRAKTQRRIPHPNPNLPALTTGSRPNIVASLQWNAKTRTNNTPVEK